MKNILTVSEFAKLLSDKDIVLVGGCFDILHIGHITFLEKAKKCGDILVILLESDQNIRKLKGINRPVHTQKQRAKILSSLKMVDFVICLPEMKKNSDYDEVIKKIKPDILATTSGDIGLHHKKRTAKLVGAKVKIVSKSIPGFSTSKILDKVSKEW